MRIILDIVVVTTAYRLAAFGAMSFGDENVLPSNLAMHGRTIIYLEA